MKFCWDPTEQSTRRYPVKISFPKKEHIEEVGCVRVETKHLNPSFNAFIHYGNSFSWFYSYALERVPIFYYHDKTRVQMFYFLNLRVSFRQMCVLSLHFVLAVNWHVARPHISHVHNVDIREPWHVVKHRDYAHFMMITAERSWQRLYPNPSLLVIRSADIVSMCSF